MSTASGAHRQARGKGDHPLRRLDHRFESVAEPLRYYANNASKSRNLIEAAVAGGVKHFIFSSTAAVYGMPGLEPAVEETPLRPISPYGRSKLMTEWMLQDAAAVHP